MTSYIFLFTLAMVLVLTNARPHHQKWSEMKNAEHNKANNVLDEIYRLVNEIQNEEQQARELNQTPELFFFTYKQKKIRHHHSDKNEHNKQKLTFNDSTSPEHAIEYDGGYLELI